MIDPAVSSERRQTARATLVLADISGYTRFLDDVGRAHGAEMELGETPPAYPLMTTLLSSIVEKLSPPFALSKLEGDAVFAYADDGLLTLRGDAMQACLVDCYRAFHEHVAKTQGALTCSCDACSSGAALDLKFVLHHGSYVAQTIAGNTELLGPDVTGVHRMLKNGVTAATGWRAYALISAAAADYLELSVDGALPMQLEYEAAEPMQAYVINLG